MLKRAEGGLSEPDSLRNAFTVARKVENKTRGHRSNARGKNAEQRLVHILGSNSIAAWFRGVRLATKKEDSRGIDAVVATSSIGPLFIQVKSSQGGVRHFEKRRRRALVTVIIVNEAMTDAEVLLACKKKLSGLHHHMLKVRKNREHTKTKGAIHL